MEIAQSLKIKVAVITDNDEDYENKIINKYSKYDSNDNINVSTHVHQCGDSTTGGMQN